MKTVPAQTRRPSPANQERGFALVVVISLMVLITILGVGMLSLSVIAMRSSAASTDRATARANARLALLLAIGELQRSAGPDQRVTARADILDQNIANPRLTGVWDSWEIKATEPPSESDYESAAKNDKFQGWLVSGGDPKKALEIDFADQSIASPVTLLGSESLAGTGTADDHVSATKVPLASPPGACAWAVLDEGIKARVNTPQIDDTTSTGGKIAQLGSGERPAAELLPGLDGLSSSQFELGSTGFATISKGVSRKNLGMAGEELAPGSGDALAALTHDVTPHSLGLFTDTARGGLREDFHLLTDRRAIAAPYNGTGVYASRLGMKGSAAPSDPEWASLYDYSTLYRYRIANFRGTPLLRAKWPSRWKASSQSGRPPVTTVNKEPPPGVVLMPTMAKVQMVFSLIGRDLYDYPPPVGNAKPSESTIFHNPQGRHFLGTNYHYDLHLLYTPIVTLHNPYNVALEFPKLQVDFQCVPFSATVYRNRRPQNRGLAPLDRMYGDNEDGSKGPKRFTMNLMTKNSAGKPGSPTFRLLPGETKMFSPYIDPERRYRDEFSGDRKFWDIWVGTGITDEIDAIPGWRGDGIGFDLDWWNPSDVKIDGDKNQGRWAGCLGLALNDRIHVEFAPQSDPKLSNNKFVITMSAATSPSSRTLTATSVIEIDYEEPDGLVKLLLDGKRTLRFPEDRDSFILGRDLLDHATTPIKDLLRVKPFALMTVHAKTTSGGRDASDEDGRYATKPWSFGHGVVAVSSQKVLSEHPANHSHEIDLQRLDSGTLNILQKDLQDRSNFITGHTAFNGIKFGSLYEIPLHPLQSFSSLNGANPGGSSGYLPRFAQPIGNSWAHPMIPADRITSSGASGTLLDHSFLLNLALYDSFYFSGLADQGGPFGTRRSSQQVAADFADGTPLDDPRLVLSPPIGRSADEFSSEMGETDAYRRAAAWQMMKGAFNINSTSRLAWKAMLASIQDAEALYNEIDKGSSMVSASTALTPLPDKASGESRISRFRLPAATSQDAGALPSDGYWLGPREYTESELEDLAERIVEQVRERGPFLSMAEFVNRQVGSGEYAQVGALQQAIDETDLNPGPAGPANAGFDIPTAEVATYGYANPDAGAGPSYQGAPGFLSQSDLLTVLGNAATARSDTFTVRAYGEARDAADKVKARAWCEAVIQRVPEWVDPTDEVDTLPASLTSDANKDFGRRFLITSFRWLNPDEI